jgi:hypothetical protein
MIGVSTGIVTLAVLPLIVGLALPADHEATQRAVYNQDPDLMWSLVSDFESWPTWNSAVTSVRRGDDRDEYAVWIFSGDRGEMPSMLTEWEPPHMLVTAIPEDAGLGFSGSWTYVIEPQGDGASVTITERGTIHRPVARFLALFLGKRAAMNAFLLDLADYLGEDVTPASHDS